MEKMEGHGLVNIEPKSSSGECVGDTKQLKGEASKDSLHGTNQCVEYSTRLSVEGLGKMGGKPSFN